MAWFILKGLVCGCGPEHDRYGMEKSRSYYKINKTGKLSSIISESSGLARVKGKNSFWTHNDSGGGEQLFEVDSTGVVLSQKLIPGVTNVDWEDLAEDRNGNVYIGDIGNNANQRRNLVVYRIHEDERPPDKISFSFADQYAYPPAKDQQQFDSEAMFYHDRSLYVFTKNGIKTNHFVKVYKMPASPGDYALTPQDSIKTKVLVTSADISPDGKKFALLTYGKILLFEVNEGKIDFSKPRSCIRFFRKQSEAILFLNNQDMMVTNEQGKVYYLKKSGY